MKMQDIFSGYVGLNKKPLRSRKSMPLGQLEQFIMLAILHCFNNAYGSDIRLEIENRIGVNVSVGALYSTLERMINKGFVGYVECNNDSPKSRKRFHITDSGRAFLNESLLITERMMSGLNADLVLS